MGYSRPCALMDTLIVRSVTQPNTCLEGRKLQKDFDTLGFADKEQNLQGPPVPFLD